MVFYDRVGASRNWLILMFIRLLKKFNVVTRPAAKVILGAFYDRRYLNGRHFDSEYIGFYWAIKSIWCKNILRLAPPMPWPTALTFKISNPKNISFEPDDLNIFQSPGVYLQNFRGRIEIGKGCYIGPNAGIITANHNLTRLDEHQEGQDVILGPGCWIGMNAVIMPGVQLGPRTIVGACAVVTKSFLEGDAVLAGVPARLVRHHVE